MDCSKMLEEIYGSVPVWPNTETIQRKHQELLDAYFACYPSLVSEFSFSSLFLFRDHHQYTITSIDKHLYVLGKDNKQKQYMFLLAALPPVHILYEFLSQGNYIKIMPISLLHLMKSCLLALKALGMKANITEDAGDFDYLYRRNDLATLSGNRYHKKRNHVNHFLEHYLHHSQDITRDSLGDVYRVLHIWREQQSDVDFAAIKEGILHFSELPLFGRIVYVNNDPAAFTIAEYRNKQSVVTVHFEKANIDYKGIYQYINRDFASSLPQHCYLINREQDLGEEGLRKAKQTYRPVRLLEKYRVYASLHE